MPAASKDDTLIAKIGKATHYTLYEGGIWHVWQEGCTDAGDIFAVKFECGWVWDSLVGWRFPT